MQKPLHFFAALIALLLSMGVAGCTLFPEKKQPTLASTTSAEAHERILWQMVQKQQWGKISPLFSATLVWNVDGKSLGADQVVPYLQSLGLKDAVVRDASIKPNGPDMTVAYTLQLSGASGSLRELSAFSVWQQVKGGGYVLIAHSEQGQTASTSASVQ